MSCSGEDHVVGTDPLEDVAVGLGDRLRPDARDADVGERRGGQDARLDVAADRHDGDLEVLRTELLERF
jgi:hypothetical protein